MKQLIPVLAIVLIPAAAAHAQDALLEGLNPAGMPTVFVTDDCGVETRGKLLRLDDEAVVVLVDGERRRTEMGRVSRVTRRGDSLKNGAIAGALVGAAIGVLTSGLVDCSDDTGQIGGCGAGTRSVMVAVSAALYASIGTSIDALVQGRTVIYQAPAARIAVGTTGGSVAMRLGW